MARLHGFPDWFRFHETKWHGARQIGNAVPPPLARAIAGKVIEALSVKPTRPSVAVALGDDDLLRMDMSRAAAFWSIENPIGRRDRKSGATKRKQHEIEATLYHALAEREPPHLDDLDLIDVGMRAELDDPDGVKVVPPKPEAANGKARDRSLLDAVGVQVKCLRP
jgi:DNA (cytosine-5)-methyltransferase 1